MEKKLICKMIKKCFTQYYEADTLPMNEQELEELTKQIFQIKKEEPAADLYEVVNEKVYEFLTK